jgi:antitoxin component YwqK of YwqJK toxin-antitoxin module
MLRRIIIAILSLATVYGSADEPLSEADVKRAFSEAIESTGFRVGEKTLAVIDIDAVRIAKSINDLRGATLHVDDSKGYRDGFCYCLYENNKIQRAGYYSRGKQIGPWRFYYPNGQLRSAPLFDAEGQQQGQSLTYFENGNIDQVELFVDGKLSGSKSTFYENGQLRLQQQFTNGVMDGLSIIYWPNGNMKKLGVFVMGRQNGVVTFYNEDGSVKEQVNYVDGVRQDGG